MIWDKASSLRQAVLAVVAVQAGIVVYVLKTLRDGPESSQERWEDPAS